MRALPIPPNISAALALLMKPLTADIMQMAL